MKSIFKMQWKIPSFSTAIQKPILTGTGLQTLLVLSTQTPAFSQPVL